MAHVSVQSSLRIASTADKVWSVVRDFCAPWHPAVETMKSEVTRSGGLVRRFTVAGEGTVYRERLTFFSDSDRCMRYCHVEGIAGVERYDAHLRVVPQGTGACVTMEAGIDAPGPRAQQVADGTRMIFDTGVREIAALVGTAQPSRPSAPVAASPVSSTRIDGLALSRAGEARGKPLCLFLHGIGGNRSNWDRQLNTLSGILPVAAMDLRGYGDSPPREGPADVDGYCDDILAVMQACGADRVVLCGLSYGAWIATSFAMRHANLLAGLVLAGGCTGMSEASAQERSAFLQSRQDPLDAGQTPADFAPDVMNVICGPLATPEIRAQLLASMQAIPVQTYADAIRCFANPAETFDFSRIKVPVLMITGAHDKLAPPQEIREVAARIHTASPRPDVRFEEIAQAGHVCNLEAPDTVNRVLAEFLSRFA